ncbi:hypothetical protein BHM03_00051307 [Ensete ventricosum]|nr:hypothetical protein BHM03_00051307 [Ensete ventricosum]
MENRCDVNGVNKESRDRIGGRVYTDHSFGFPVDMGAAWQEGVANNVLQWYLCRMEGWFATDSDNISLKNWDQEVLLPGGHGLMVRGYRPIINTLAKGLDIRLSHRYIFSPKSCSRVTKIVRGKKGVEVTVNNDKSFFADAAIVTVPLGVLKAKSIEFEPRLPEWKEAAIDGIGVGVENKIVLHFDKVFWPNVEFLGIVSSTSYGCSYFLNLHKATGHPVLVYMPAGRLAQDIEKMSDESAAKFAFSQLKLILPDVTEPVYFHFLSFLKYHSISSNAAIYKIQYLVSQWGRDENSLGSYSYDAVGKPRNLFERLRIPVDNLFFAGEATSIKYTGTVHGAFSTGLMAAEECRMRVLEKYGDLEHLEMFHPAMDEEAASISVPLLISRM